jgi:metal-responsive CopG/Arc/MetJ family transcriptional regulator
MKQDQHHILGIHVDDRIKRASDVQQLLTDYGCNIKTRIGLHEVTGKFCAGFGLILLEMIGETGKIGELAKKLEAIEGVSVQQMVFDHP